MSGVREVTCRPRLKPTVRRFVVLAAAGAILSGTGLAVVRVAYRDGPADAWVCVGLFAALLGVVFLYGAVAKVRADAYGVRSRTLLRRRSVPWHDIADLRVYVQYARSQEIQRIEMVLRGGRTRRLPLPASASSDDRADFDAKLDALRALHRLYGTPESSHVAVISKRTAGRGTAVPLTLCVLLLAGAGLAAWFVPATESLKRAWESAVPCAAEAPARECLTTLPAVITRAEVGKGKQRSWLYFAEGRPLERLSVSQEGARGFRPGDRVELTVWRREVREVTGEHHVWREHFPGGGDVAVVAAGCALAAGYPASLVLLRRRGRRLPADEVLPSALPFAGALVATALWLLPLCYLHPTAPPTSPGGLTWAVAGSLATLGLFTWAWRATRIRTPHKAAAARTLRKPSDEDEDEEVFLAARFLESTDYNPNNFGTHIVLGGGPPAVTPHPGPGRFAAKRIPVERLTVKDVRRPRGGDGDTVPRGWQIAELDDAGRPVHLAAAPADLARIVQALSTPRTPAHVTRPDL
ncbi:PH domain-containing protein [Streptomyces ferrugineus]|uniref:PH domain-containing protein n=1 Tax=Streptomyces ferrugineus TaxID=1413221 RepID=A0A7M2SMF2_9ACTN|nr:PH domain-containing protein [Streptomyces ferrugineus]QOV36895.1 PH domain-containing protein [Streptomyces ferrugineus]